MKATSPLFPIVAMISSCQDNPGSIRSNEKNSRFIGGGVGNL